MAVKKKDNKTEVMHSKVNAGIQKAMAELYQHHSGQIQENLDEAEDKKVAVTFACDIDCSESEPLVTVRIRFSSSITDKRVFRLDPKIDVENPDQFVLYPSAKAARPEVAEGEAGAEDAARAAEGEAGVK